MPLASTFKVCPGWLVGWLITVGHVFKRLNAIEMKFGTEVDLDLSHVVNGAPVFYRKGLTGGSLKPFKTVKDTTSNSLEDQYESTHGLANWHCQI